MGVLFYMSDIASSSSAKMNKNLVFYAKFAVYLLITFGFGFLPPFGDITPLGMHVLGIFLGTIFGWIMFEMAWPSFVALLGLAWVGYGTISGNVGTGFSYYMIPLMFVCYITCGIFTDSKAAHFIAEWIISRKICAGRPEVIVGSIFVVALVIGLCNTGFAGIFIVWSFIYALADAMGYDRKEGWVQYLACAICVIVIQGGQCFPFYTGAIVYNAIFINGTGLQLPFIGFCVVNIAIDIVLAAVLYLICIFGIRPDFTQFRERCMSGCDVFADYRGKKMDFDQKVGFIFLIAFIVLLAAPNLVPKDTAIYALLNSFGGVLGTSMILSVLAALIRRKDGTAFFDIAKASQKHISWSVMWLIIAVIPLANAFGATECGILTTITGALEPLVGNMNPLIFAVFCMLIVGVSTQVITNLVLAIVFVPVFCGMAINMGGNPYLVYILMYWALNLAFTTPAASMNAVIMHGNENVKPKWAYGTGLIILIAGSIVTVAVGAPLVSIFMPF